MNPSVNRSSESTRPSNKQPREVSHSSTQPDIAATEIATASSGSTAPDSGETANLRERQQPIPPPSNPRQYRAIGLIQGQYQRSTEQMTKGELVTSEGTAINAVLLGRVISLVKNHLDLEKPHLWVVYPRTRQINDDLHVQIVGVWEPETLSKQQLSTAEETTLTQAEALLSDSASPSESYIQDGYFSVRGEVVFYSQDQEKVIVKIKQAPKRESEKPQFFKLRLSGELPDKPVGHFWDLHIQLQGDNLVIQQANDLGLLPSRRKKPFPSRERNLGPSKKGEHAPSPSRPLRTQDQKPQKSSSPVNRPPIPKPIKADNRKSRSS